MALRPRFWPTAITLPALAVLLALGTWQVDRLGWKSELIAAREAAARQPPLRLDAIPGDLAGLIHRRVGISGRFLHEFEVHLVARTHAGRLGLHVVTPLRLADGGLILVNRGWVPRAARDPAARPDGQLAGPVAVAGRLREPPRAGPFTPDNDLAANQWYWLDLGTIAARLGEPVAPLVLIADATANPGGLPIGEAKAPGLRNNHLQYAITWYGLALALAVIYLLYHRNPKARP